MEYIRRILRQRTGSTMVELIVSFALLGIFMIAATECVLSVLSTYYRMRQLNDAQAVAGALLQSIRAQLQKARGGENEYYIKLLNDNGVTISLDRASTAGSTVEFICPVRSKESLEVISFVSQIDAKGINTSNGGSEGENSGYLVQRYYPYGEDPLLYHAYSAELMYPKGSYMGLTADVAFSIPKEALEEGKVRYMIVAVTLKHGEEECCTASTAVQLANQPVYYQ